MRILKNIIKIFLTVIIFYHLLYFTFVYKDVILSINAKKGLKGKIVYSFGGRDIKVIELPSGKKKNIYSVPEEPIEHRYLGSVGSPSFSPDGKRIVFSKRDDPRINFRYKLYMMNSDGTNIKKFLDFGDADLLSPSWSPDGEKIAFAVRKSERGGEGGLYVVEVNNPAFISCVSNILPSRSQSTWSPDSKKIAFSSEELFRKTLAKDWYAETNLGGIYIVDIFNKISNKFIDLAHEPSWSPDGKRLAYEGEKGYYVVNINEEYTNNYYPIVPYKIPFFSIRIGSLFPLRWSPDGKYIAFGKEIWPGIAGLYVVSVDNPKRQIRIATEHKAIGGMSWVK
jgi:Tol biopolymer transport system component